MAEHTSARAAFELDRLGVKDVKALQGGIQAWVNAGYPLEKGQQEARAARRP